MFRKSFPCAWPALVIMPVIVNAVLLIGPVSVMADCDTDEYGNLIYYVSSTGGTYIRCNGDYIPSAIPAPEIVVTSRRYPNDSGWLWRMYLWEYANTLDWLNDINGYHDIWDNGIGWTEYTGHTDVSLELVSGSSVIDPRTYDGRRRDLRVVTSPPFDDLVIEDIVKTRVSNYGGHNHSPDNNDIECRGATNVDNGSTDQYGVFEFYYRAPEYSGEYEVKVKYWNPETDTRGEVVYNFTVRVDGLQQFTGGTGITLTGSTSSHPDNHYGTPTTNQKLAQLGAAYYSQFGENLVVNDMSLPHGGKFDIGPPSGQYWRSPHDEHREGLNADIYPTSPDSTKWEWLKRYIRDDLGSDFYDHTSEAHPHLHFREH